MLIPLHLLNSILPSLYFSFEGVLIIVDWDKMFDILHE